MAVISTIADIKTHGIKHVSTQTCKDLAQFISACIKLMKNLPSYVVTFLIPQLIQLIKQLPKTIKAQ